MRILPVWMSILVLGLLTTACATVDTAAPTTHRSEASFAGVAMSGTAVPTHQGVGGNRFRAGAGRPAGADTFALADEQISWVAGFAGTSGSVIVAVDADGRVAVAGAAGEAASDPPALPSGMPPLVVPSLGTYVVPPFEGATRFSAPTLVDDDTALYVSESGELVVLPAEGRPRRVAVDALLDGRIAMDAGGRALVLTEPTDRYGHAVLGDAVEAAGFAVVDVAGGSVIARHTLDAPAVFEAVVPMWADLDGDGGDDIVLTLSEPDGGARIVVYQDDGTLLAEGPPIGRGFRWRHLIAAGPFGPEGEIEIAVVRTPHIGGVLEMYRLEDGELVIVESLAGPFGSHAIGSRNLDMAVAGDFDRDGRPEVVLPTANRRSIIGVVHRSGGLEEVWAFDLAAPLTSNLGVVQFADGGLRLVAGLADGSVVEWSP